MKSWFLFLLKCFILYIFVLWLCRPLGHQKDVWPFVSSKQFLKSFSWLKLLGILSSQWWTWKHKLVEQKPCTCVFVYLFVNFVVWQQQGHTACRKTSSNMAQHVVTLLKKTGHTKNMCKLYYMCVCRYWFVHLLME